MSFTTQVFANGETVAKTNMLNTFTNPTEVIDAYFPKVTAIASGIGNIQNRFGQSGTSNAFTFTAGNFRFADQVGPIGTDSFFTMGDYAGATVNITCPSGSSPQYYIVAALIQTSIDAYQFSTTANILATAMTLAQVNLNPTDYVIICAITNTSGVYTVFIDSNCATNYGVNVGVLPSIYNPNINLLVSTVTSSVNPNWTSKIWQQPLSTGDATNGYVETRVEASNTIGSTIHAISQFKNSWNIVGGVVKPTIVSYMSDIDGNRGTIFNSYIEPSSDKLQMDSVLFSTLSPAVVDSGFRLTEGDVPIVISSNIASLTIQPNSVMVSRWFKPLHDTTTGITGIAIWNGTNWIVTLGGKLEYLSTANANIVLTKDLNVLFGISGATPNAGTATAYGAVPNSTNMLGSSSVGGSALELFIQMAIAVTVLVVNFSITFQCTNVT